jgi:phosphoribosyl-ATP pyrophosphohydrolase/phosphoribosyl-AMP cyclohydrolase
VDLSAIWFDAGGLVPVVAQDVRTGRALMLAFADREAVEKTLETGFAHYHSRSRGTLWKKGETSGHVQRVTEVRLDCDGDALLYLVDPAGPACHTGEASCWFRKLEPGGAREIGSASPAGDILATLYEVVLARARSGGARSYVRTLLEAGAAAVAAKVREEAGEVAQALEAPEGDEALVSEVADLWFHTVVALGARGVPPERVLAELRRRFGTSGIDEKESRAKSRDRS